jgi:hypothetical protein
LERFDFGTQGLHLVNEVSDKASETNETSGSYVDRVGGISSVISGVLEMSDGGFHGFVRFVVHDF